MSTEKPTNDVEINIEAAEEDETNSNGTIEAGSEVKPVAPIVPYVANQSEEVSSRPKSNSRGRQLKPGTGTAGGGANSGGRSRSGSRSPSRRTRRDTGAAQNDALPLLPSETAEGRLPRQRPPLAGPEMDIDGPDDYDRSDRRGIDDGFLPEKPGIEDDGGRELARRTPAGGRRNSVTRNFPFAPEYGPGGPTMVTHIDGSTRIVPDVNVYQQKKNLAQGMMDLALLSANANQLRYVLESYSRHPYFYFSLVFISTSIIAQVAVGIGLIWKSRYNIKNEDDFCKADRINNMVTIGIFIITLVNVLISAFGVADPPKTN
uniref:Putative conserved plasma membrane protein n=1 Tax=Culex tarsalis TaxID=7177 RepID=A0A1Q3FIV6_CULTA